MAKCDACGNDYDKSFEVKKGGRTYTFDSFECAIHLLAPTCEHCGVRIVGHGLEKDAECSAATIAQNTKALPSCATALDRAARLTVELRYAQPPNARFRIRHEIEHIPAFEAGKKFAFERRSVDDGFHVERDARQAHRP